MIAASHQNLANAVSEGRFRHDLFFRICAFQIELPALRDRESDCIQLAEYFANQLAKSSRRSVLAESTKAEIRSREWNGNVRELRNAIEHALILARGNEILPEHLPDPVDSVSPGDEKTGMGNSLQEGNLNQLIRSWTASRIRSLREHDHDVQDLYEDFLAQFEPAFLTTVMEHFDNQYVAASKALGIHRTTLKKKLLDHQKHD